MRPAVRHGVLAIQRRLLGFDTSVAGGPLPDTPPPLFLVGAPRTGSTLFAQALLGRYRLAYISNAMALAPRYMVRMVRAWPRLAGPYGRTVRDSSWGYVPGLLAPNEAGGIMAHWFGATDATRAGLVARTVASISHQVGAPMFFKNQANTLRLAAVLETFPQARFVFLRRDPLYTAQSILLAREAILGSRSAWWSVRPPACSSDGRDPCREVVCQIAELERMARTLAPLGPERFVEVRYEDFCMGPETVLEDLARRFSLVAQAREGPALSPFPPSRRVRVDVATWERLGALWDEMGAVPLSANEGPPVALSGTAKAP